MTLQCFVIFEGGGAKGITHIGALRALDDIEMARIGAAGTSAGAIVAALSAVGYSADELIRSDGPDASGREADDWNILAKRGKVPTDLLGGSDWLIFAKLFPSGRSAAAKAVVDLMRFFVIGALCFIQPIWPLMLYFLKTERPRVFGAIRRIVLDFGFFSTHPARELLNDIIFEKLYGRPNTDREFVCFRDIDPEVRPDCIALKIIATNLETGSVQLFDRKTPDIVVADAVAASFAIPLFFKPARIRTVDAHDPSLVTDSDARYVDGGLVSNLPVWAFSEDKRMVERSEAFKQGRPIPIVAFTLVESEIGSRSVQVQRGLAALGNYVVDVLRSGIFGGQSVVETFVPHLTVVELPSPLTVVQFDCGPKAARNAYQVGRDAGFVQLNSVFRINPYVRHQGMTDLLYMARNLSNSIRTEKGLPPISHLRVCLMRQLGNRSFKVIQSINMDEDTDDDLVLDQRNPGAPTAFNDKDFAYVDVLSADFEVRMTKYERALLRKSVQSIVAFPIFSNADEWDQPDPNLRNDPVGVFCIDSDFKLDLEFANREFLRAIAVGTTQFAKVMPMKGETS